MQLDQQYIDPLNKQLLNEIQWTFPLSQKPYLEIATKHGLTENDVMSRISLMKSTSTPASATIMKEIMNLTCGLRWPFLRKEI